MVFDFLKKKAIEKKKQFDEDRALQQRYERQYQKEYKKQHQTFRLQKAKQRAKEKVEAGGTAGLVMKRIGEGAVKFQKFAKESNKRREASGMWDSESSSRRHSMFYDEPKKKSRLKKKKNPLYD